MRVIRHRIKWKNINLTGLLDGTDVIFKETKDENFPKLMNNMQVQAQKERALNRINTNHLYLEAYVSTAKILKDRLAVPFVLKIRILRPKKIK